MPQRQRPSLRDTQRRLGSRVRDLRKQQSMTQEVLGARCGLSQKYISELERGVTAPSFATLVALAHRGFGVRIARLVYGIDEEVQIEARAVEDLLAGRRQDVRDLILRAIEMLLTARVLDGGRSGGAAADENAPR